MPLTTGSTVDTLARALSTPLAKALGQPVVVENLAGAGGVSGTAQMVRAPKDGQTLALVSSNHVINPAIYPSMPFDSLKDITPITVIGTLPLVLFGLAGYGARQGLMMVPARAAHAFAPVLFGMALDRAGAAALWLTTLLGLAALAALWLLRPVARA